jgi:hypothetical protein
MKVWGATEAQIRDTLAETGLKVYGEWNDYGARNGIYRDGRALRFRLAVDTTQDRNADGFLPYQRMSTALGVGEGRKIAAVCWHGHRDFMRALFRRAPEARIKTALADYRGELDFERKYPDTFGAGNHYNLSYGQACGCSSRVRLAA